MGASYTNILLYGPRNKQVAKHLKEVNPKIYVSPTIGQYTVMYDTETGWQDESALTDLACALSRSLNCPALAVMVYDSDVFRYWLFEEGNLADRYDSWPEYSGADVAEPSHGDTKRLCTAFGADSVQRVADILRKGRLVHEDSSQGVHWLFADYVHRELAKALGVPSFATHSADGYDYPEIDEKQEGVASASGSTFKSTGSYLVELRSEKDTGETDASILVARLRSLGIDASVETAAGRQVRLRLRGAAEPSRMPTLTWRRRTFELHLVAPDQSPLLPSNHPEGFPGLQKGRHRGALTDAGDLTEFFLGPSPASLAPLIGSVDLGPDLVVVPQANYPVAGKYRAKVIEATALVQTTDIVSARAGLGADGNSCARVSLSEEARQRLSSLSVPCLRRMAFVVDGIVEAAPVFGGNFEVVRELRAGTSSTAEDSQLLAASLNQPELASDWVLEAVHTTP